MWTRKELKARAKQVLRVTYWKAFLVSLILGFVGENGGTGVGSLPVDMKETFPANNWDNQHWELDDFPSSFMQSFEGLANNEFFPFMLSMVVIVLLFIIVVIILFALAFRIFLFNPLIVGGRRYFVRSAALANDLNDLGYGFRKTKYVAIVKAMLWKNVLHFLWFLLLIIPGIVKGYAYQMVPYILADNANIGYKRALELSNRMTAGHKFRMFVLDLSFIGWYFLGLLAFVIGILFVMPYENATKAELYLALRQDAIDKGIGSYEDFGLIDSAP